MIYLSKHFTIDEFTFSQTASRNGILNNPPPEIVPALHHTAKGMELVRKALGNVPVLVSSGYRSPALNAIVGGQISSQHLLGEAVDFTAPTFGNPNDIICALAKSKVPYDQLILEFGRWVHISFSDRDRRQILVIDHTGTRPWSS